MDLKSGRKEAKQLKSVYATTAEGVVWFAVGQARPRSSGKAPFEFLEGSYCRDADEVRVLAMPQNSPLIRDAFAHSLGTPCKVYLAGPSMVPAGATAADPSEVVIAARATAGRRGPVPAEAVGGRPSSLGGWHLMRALEWQAYILAAAVVEGDVIGDFDEEFADHPVLRRIAFAAPLDRTAALRVVAEIRDPRWFVDPDKPESPARLASYFGLGGARARNVGRRLLVDDAWGRDAAVAGEGDPDDPRAFAVAHYRSRRDEYGEDAAAARTSRFFLEFIRRAWLEALHPHVGDGLMAPDLFFARVDRGLGDRAGSAGAYRRSMVPGE